MSARFGSIAAQMGTQLFGERQRDYGGVLALIGLLCVFQLVSPNEDWARFVGIALGGGILLTAMRAAGAVSQLLRGALVAYVVLVAGSALVLLSPGEIPPAASRLTTLLLILLAPPIIVRGLLARLRRDRVVTVQVVYGALCLYLLLGLAFSFTFGLVDDLGDKPFFAGATGAATPNDLLYFSLTTLTTTGYGDFTAGTEIGRAFAITEALLGQIYLVTVIALLVANLRRSPEAAEGGDAEPG